MFAPERRTSLFYFPVQVIAAAGGTAQAAFIYASCISGFALRKHSQ